MKGNISKLPLWIATGAVAVLLALMMSQPGNTSATQQEQRIAEVLSAIAGAGKVEVVLYYAPQETSAFASVSSAAPTGALIVAQGAEDMAVRLNLIRAVRTLLGLPETAVDVFAMEGETR